ncbi:MAG: AAA family ATPase [Gammaproteobacteria bacterium]|nr:AAA family ATPase [Gammaproteobacteria bacterium]
MSDERDLEMLLTSHFPITTINTHEEKRALELMKKVVTRTARTMYTWSVTEGLKAAYGHSADNLRLQDDSEYMAYPTTEPKPMLEQVKKSLENAVVVLLDFHPYLNEPLIIRLLKEIALEYSVKQNTLVLLSHELTIPGELERLTARFSLSLPDASQLEQLIFDEAKVWTLKNQNQSVKADRQAMQMLIRNLQGLTMSDARRLVRNAIYHDGAITEDDLPAVMKAKYELLGQGGVLSFEYETAQFAEVGGFKKLITWINHRKVAFLQDNLQAKDTALDMPKGIMLLGVQGSGKSLAAKAVAGAWEVPLLRMDFGALYNKFFGETEKNIRDSLKAAEVMAPCVLWMDEIEKGIATGAYDSGTSRRVLASLLTWMAENKKPVFIVATANDIESLPPELIRKGRLDEIFFVDLPAQNTRAEIFAIHLAKRGQQPPDFDIQRLAAETDGFSGAEIEQAVVAALYAAHARSTTMTTQHILEEIKSTQPLSVVMAEKISALQRWAEGRTVAAN